MATQTGAPAAPAPLPTAQCFVKLNNQVASPPGWSACGNTNATSPFASCCQNGDYCMEAGICKYTSSRPGGSGFYVAGCTDRDYRAGTCPQLCNSQSVKDAVFNQNPARYWKCCGGNPDGTPHCDRPTDENFDAPRADRLDTTFQANVGTPSTSSSAARTRDSDSGATTIQASTTTTTSPPQQVIIVSDSASGTSSANSDNKLSAGAAGGIGAGAAVLLIAIALIAFLFFRRRKRKVRQEQQMSHSVPPGGVFSDFNQPPGTPQEVIRRYDSAGTNNHDISPYTPGASGTFDRKEYNGSPRPPTEMYGGEHALEMPGDGMLTPVPTRVLGHEESSDSIRGKAKRMSRYE